MSCETNPNRIAKLASQVSGGISQLSGKRAFFAGVAVGAGGTGLGALIVARRRSINFWQWRRGKKGLTRQVRPKPGPISGLTGASSPAKPKPIPGLAGASSSAKPGPIPGLAKKKPLPTLVDKPQTKLQRAPVRLLSSDGTTRVIDNSFRVVRFDGSDTGLAITPHLESDGAGGAGQQDAWSVTHTGSGALVDGPYESITRAQGLATELAVLPWTAPTMPAGDVTRAKKIINQYRETPAGGTASITPASEKSRGRRDQPGKAKLEEQA